MDIRLPNITASTPAEQMAQMRSYIYQLSSELSFALNTLEGNIKSNSENIVLLNKSESNPAKPRDTFDSIKELIIKSADIVKAYQDTMEKEFNGQYVAISDFGTYTEDKLLQLNFTPDSIAQEYYNKQSVDGMISAVQDSQSWIRSGLLEEVGGIPTYGVEVGQKTKRDGVDIFDKYARFTAEGIYFYLPGETNAVAWMSGRKLYIRDAEITQSIKLGHYVCDLSDGVALRWVGA